MGVLPMHMWAKRPPFGAKRPPPVYCPVTYITMVWFNLTTQLSVVYVISIILYKYLTIFDKRIPCFTPQLHM